MKWLIPLKRLVFLPTINKWCQLPYPNHKKGCPNYNNPKRLDCPPRARRIQGFFDLTKLLYFVHSEFDLEADIIRRKKMNPNLTEKQYRCVLYWQGTSRKQLKERVNEVFDDLDVTYACHCPEGRGLNVYATARINGLYLDRIRNLKIVRHIALLGTLKW